MPTRLASLLFVVAVAAGAAAEADSDLPPPYVPRQRVSGRISIWGHGSLGGRVDFMESLVKAWEAGFLRHQPGVTFENRLHGTASAIGALYTGTGDLALMGREIWPMEVAAFKEVRGYEPTGIDVLTGSFKARNRGYAIVVFVHKSNPLDRLTLDQLGAAYCARPGRGAPARTWGDLGLSGEWKHRRIHPMGFPIARGFADFFSAVVFQGGRLWSPDLLEFPDEPGSQGGATDGGQRMLDTLAQDAAGIAYSGLLYAHPGVKPLALAAREGDPFVTPSEATVLDHSYPLTRIITLFLDRAPGQPVAPRLSEFVRYVLSREAQEAVRRDGGGYLPLLDRFAQKERGKLE